ncbi:efflux RND transporter periplasmic adaptor subunit [Xanthocytophaga flava]|uniref:efflux RND transporter periplasmic adaptor subunit n=1 Tax=Xanthocytophaga flava TaxID=3048013 RepID=UPI0028D3F64B|nr:efflux RND transporter periplasmic adaptor subunit [Xanthocytophaga flavus]MDJ1466423.1 efflux RND transporter periplasmic adaptor subunit [Xanthocytophaga flavus]
MKFWIPVTLVVLALGGVIYYNKIFTKSHAVAGNTSGQPQEIAIQGFVAKSKSLTNNLVASGTLMPAEQIEIHPEVSGRIISLNINEGREVAAGTLLVKLYDADLKAQLRKLQVQKENQEKIVERSKKLLNADNISQQDYDLTTTTLNTILSDIDLIKAQIEKTEVRAPFRGVIGLRNVSLGAYITPSTLITKLQQINPLKIDFFVPEKYAVSIAEGDKVAFAVDGFGENFSGKIYAIEPDIDQATRSLKIRALVSNPSAKLHPGAFAKVNLDVENITAVVIPTQAIIPQTRGKKVVISKNGKAVFQDVVTGLRDESNVQVTQGLTAGDTVITTGLLFVKPEQNLKFTKIEE